MARSLFETFCTYLGVLISIASKLDEIVPQRAFREYEGIRSVSSAKACRVKGSVVRAVLPWKNLLTSLLVPKMDPS